MSTVELFIWVNLYSLALDLNPDQIQTNKNREFHVKRSLLTKKFAYILKETDDCQIVEECEQNLVYNICNNSFSYFLKQIINSVER